MTSFEYLYGTLLGECILRNIDNLSKALQNPEMSAAEAQHIVKLTTSTLQSIQMFNQFWWNILQVVELMLVLQNYHKNRVHQKG